MGILNATKDSNKQTNTKTNIDIEVYWIVLVEWLVFILKFTLKKAYSLKAFDNK